MREIKFRYTIKRANGYIFQRFFTLKTIEDGSVKTFFKANSIGVGDTVFREQFTGLKDKNGVEIYEGDIVKYMDGKSMEVFYSTSGYASWNLRRKPDHGGKGLLIYGLYNYSDTPGAHEEVIGNIHEHPNLLETNAKKLQQPAGE